MVEREPREVQGDVIYVSADYKTRIGVLLNARPVGLETLYDPDGLSEYFRTLY